MGGILLPLVIYHPDILQFTYSQIGGILTQSKETMEPHSHPEVIKMQVQLDALSQKVDYHEGILVRGVEGNLSLPEVVRNLTLTVDSYIKRKEQEEEEKKQSDARKKEQWDKLRWVIIGTVVPMLIVFIIQAAIFFFRFVPIMLELANK